MGPITVFDKSALQSLSIDEAVWFDAFFLGNVVPIFYVETLADLEKEVAEGKTPEEVVGRLAEKTPSGAVPNVYHRDLVLAEMSGQRIPMTGQAVIGGGDVKRAADGSIGVHVDEFPEAAALLRWRSGEFLEIERIGARRWRAELAEHDPARLVALLKNILSAETKISNLEQLKVFIDSFCASAEPEVIALALDVLGVPSDHRRAGVDRWLVEGKPPLDEFAPYTTHVFKVDLLYYLGIHRSFISGERPSNKADMAYLYYLPFAMAFVSGDRLHRRTAPLFLREDQSYLQAEELKEALREFDSHYDRLTDEIKQLGVLAFASYPTSDVENLVTRLWDKHMRPDWRDIAKRLEAGLSNPRDVEADRETLEEVKRRFERARSIPADDATASQGDPDYFAITRQVPATKGKWRMVSKEVAEADRPPQP